MAGIPIQWTSRAETVPRPTKEKKTRHRIAGPWPGCMTTAQYTLRNLISTGRDGKVYTCVDQRGTVHAVKMFRKTRLAVTSWKPRDVVWMERLTNVPNVIKLTDWFRHGNNVGIVTPYSPTLVDLFNHLSGTGPLTEANARVTFGILVPLLATLAAKGWYHMDLKTENVLLDLRSFQPTLIDLDGMVSRSPGERAVPQTASLFPPESNCSLTPVLPGPACVWAVGVMALECVCGHKQEDVHHTKYARCETDLGELEDGQWCKRFVKDVLCGPDDLSGIDIGQTCDNFIRVCMARDPTRRPTLSELAGHQWLTSPDQGPGIGEGRAGE